MLFLILRVLSAILIAALIPSPADAAPVQKAPVRQKAAAEEHYRQWLDRDVAYIITPEEKAVYLKLATAEEKDRFIEQFWLRRDPDRATSANEFKDEHYRRIAYVNKYFGSGIPGWKTDRGKIYILHGEPAQIESHSGGSYQRTRSEGGGTTSAFPFEIWTYRHIEGIGDDIRIEFVDKTMTGKFTIATDASEKDALLRIPGQGKTLLEEAGAASKTDRVLGINQQQAFLQMGKSIRDLPFERLAQNADLEKAPPIRFKELQQLITAKVTYNTIPLQVSWDHFGIDDRRALVPVTVSLPADTLTYKVESGKSDRYATLQLYGRISDVSGRMVYEFDQESSFYPSPTAGSFLLQRQFLLAPGRYRLELVIKDTVANQFGTGLVGLVIPSYPAGQPGISSLLLARKIEILKEPPAGLEPFIYGDLRVIPETSFEFKPEAQLGVYFQVTSHALDGQNTAPAQLTYRILRDGVAVEEVQDVEGLTIHRVTNGRLIAYAFLSLRKLGPGLYTVEVACNLPDGNKVAANREIRIL
jgi:GWxTD domain-containing protein